MSGTKTTILVIDDDRGVREILTYAIKEEGYEVITATNGEEGLKTLAENDIDIVLTDLMMPKIDGLTVLARSKEIKPAVEVIMITAYGSMESAIEAMRKGAFDYINKPVNMGELMAIIAKACEVRSLKSQLISLQELDRLKEEFFNTVTHELKSPLTTIICAIDAQMDPKCKDDADGGFLLDIIKRETEKVRSLVMDLLDFAKMDAGAFKIDRQGIEPPVIVYGILKEAALIAEKKNIKLVNKCPESSIKDRIEIKGDFKQLQRVLSNLVNNAIQYTQEGGAVTVWFERNETETRFTVEDNGKGIDRKNIEKVFDRFYRIEEGGGKHVKGFGLGLSICKKIVDMHKGRIWAESEGPGKGSRFIFSIPNK